MLVVQSLCHKKIHVSDMYQGCFYVLLLVHDQVNGQNPLVQPKFSFPKIDIFLIS